MRTDDGAFAVLNAELISTQLDLPEPPSVSFDGEDLDERLARRHVGWTPVVGDELSLE